MAETKDELLEQAKDVGVDPPPGATKAQIQEALEGRIPTELGPVIRPGSDLSDVTFEGHGNIKGVQPVDADDLKALDAA